VKWKLIWWSGKKLLSCLMRGTLMKEIFTSWIKRLSKWSRIIGLVWSRATAVSGVQVTTGLSFHQDLGLDQLMWTSRLSHTNLLTHRDRQDLRPYQNSAVGLTHLSFQVIELFMQTLRPILTQPKTSGMPSFSKTWRTLKMRRKKWKLRNSWGPRKSKTSKKPKWLKKQN